MNNSPYLDLPLRTLAKARADIALRRQYNDGILAAAPAVKAKLQAEWGFRRLRYAPRSPQNSGRIGHDAS